MRNSHDYANPQNQRGDYYCNPDGSICVYRNICYSLDDELWHASGDPKNFPLLNDDNFTASHTLSKVKNRCNERFTPVPNGTFPNAEDMIFEEGPTYFVCCWVGHFGHIFVQMMVSAFHALVKMGFEDNILSGSIKYLIEYRGRDGRDLHGSKETAFQVFKFLTDDGNRVQYLSDLKEKATAEGKSSFCFEQLVVGMRFTDLAYPRFKGTFAPEAEVGMLDPLRNHLDELYPSTEEAVEFALSKTQTEASKRKIESLGLDYTPPRECTLTFLQRGGGRKRAITNFVDVMNATKTVFHEPKWKFQRVAFDDVRLMKQYLTVRNTMLFVSVSGTGSHLAMFLPDDAVSIEVHYNNTLKDVNAAICHVLPKLKCLSSNSHCPSTEPQEEDQWLERCKDGKVQVEIESFKEAIKVAKMELSDKCDMAMAKKVD